MEPIRKTSTSRLVFERLRGAIHLSAYLPGEMLPPEREIADQLGVSREMVRDAIRRLAKEGYISSRRGPNGGHVVTELNLPKARRVRAFMVNAESLDHLMEFRMVNERLAAHLAAERRQSEDLERMACSIDDLAAATNIQRFRRADSAFHLAVAEASRNPHVVDAITMAREEIFLLHGTVDYEIVLETSLYSHRRIFEAIRRQSAALAAQEMERHLDVAGEEIRDVLIHDAADNRDDGESNG